MNPEAYGVGHRLQLHYGLNVLRISMDAESGNALLSFSGPDGEQIALLTAPAHELGLPLEMDSQASGDWDLNESAFRLPDYLRGALKSAVSATEPEGQPVWITLVPPLGLLAAVPWERLLHPVVGVPVLRLPCHSISPRPPQREFDSVICFSSPVSQPEVERELIDLFLAQVPLGLVRQTTLHLFADASVHQDLLALKLRYGSEFHIEVYDPPPQSELQGRLPWLKWIEKRLAGRSADVVHFLSHCYRIREQAALALAESPSRNDNKAAASLIFAPDLVEFLDAVGSWSVAFSSPPSNVSAAGMRMLIDQVARIRPGPIFLHDMTHPHAREGLAATYGYLYGDGPPPDTGAVTLFTHPQRCAPGRHTDETSERLLHEFTLVGHLGDRVASAGQPAWLVSSQRVLEATAGEVAASVEQDAESGKKRARDLVLRALAEAANAPDSGPEEPQ
jgi:hypothetical protein